MFNHPSPSGRGLQFKWLSVSCHMAVQLTELPCGYWQSRKQRVIGFMTCLCLGSICFTVAGFTLPFIAFKARKFATLFTLGSVFCMARSVQTEIKEWPGNGLPAAKWQLLCMRIVELLLCPPSVAKIVGRWGHRLMWPFWNPVQTLEVGLQPKWCFPTNVFSFFLWGGGGHGDYFRSKWMRELVKKEYTGKMNGMIRKQCDSK